jgi:hypothetical protein
MKINSLIIIPFMLLLAGCQSTFGDNIIIVEKDSTAPMITFIVSYPGGNDASVSTAGFDQKLELISNAGPLNMRVIGTDSESGIQSLEIWVSKKITSCDSNQICSMKGPLGGAKPTFELNLPQKLPGEETEKSSTLAQKFELFKEISDAGIPADEHGWVDFTFYAVVVNHLGGRRQSPNITARWEEW